jgi:hypothetical protein
VKFAAVKLGVVCVSLILGLILTGVSNAQVDPKTCIGAWLFDEGSGNVAKDSTKNGNNGTVASGPKWVQGKFGKALEFDGASGNVVVPKSAGLNLDGKDFTIVVWANSYKAGVWKPFVNKYQAGADHTMILAAIRDNNNLTLASYNDDLNVAYTPKLNTWEHYAFTFNAATKKREIFVNGSSVGNGVAGGAPSGSNVQDIEIGSMAYAKLYYSGIIDEVGIFNVVLTQDAVKNIMANGITGATGLTPLSPKGLLTTAWGEIRGNVGQKL